MKQKYENLKNKLTDIKREFSISDDRTFVNVYENIFMSEKKTLRLLSKRGNLKVGEDTLIFNMGPAYKCPSDELGMCKVSNKCYAKKAEDQYWLTASHYRNQQAIYWKNITAQEFVNEFIDIYNKAQDPIKYIRFNESGDFYTQACVDKLLNIAKLLHDNNIDVVIYTYTARTDLNFDDCLKQHNLVINGSGFMLDNNFDIYYDDKQLNKGDVHCVGDCSICKLCKIKKQKTIKIKIH